MRHSKDRIMKKNIIIVLLSVLFSLPTFADIVVVGNPALPDGLTKKEAKRIFLGKKDKYSQGDLYVIELSSTNPMKAEFHKRVTKKSLAQLESYWSKQLFTGKATPPLEVADANTLKATIAQHSNGIGYIDEADVDSSVKVLFKP